MTPARGWISGGFLRSLDMVVHHYRRRRTITGVARYLKEKNPEIVVVGGG